MSTPIPSTFKTPYVLRDEERDIIQRLIIHQGEKTDVRFAEKLEFGGSTWNKIKSALLPEKHGGYFAEVKDTDRIFKSLRESLFRLDRASERKERASTESFYEFKPFSAVFKAIDQCLVKARNGDPNRFNIFRAETGCGKTALGQQISLSEDYIGIVTEARENWRTSGWSAHYGIAEACGLPVRELWNAKLMQDALIKFGNSQKVVLYLDEGEYFGPSALNLLKLLLNQSSMVIVVGALPKSYERWTDPNKSTWHEAKQLMRRTHAVIDGPGAGSVKISDDEALRFFATKGWSDRRTEKFARLAAIGANTFGGFDFLKRLHDETVNDPDSEEEVQKLIAKVHAFMGVRAQVAKIKA